MFLSSLKSQRWFATRWSLALAGLFGSVLVFAAGGGTMSESSMPSTREMSPQELARSAYNDGVRAVKQATKYETDAAKATKEDKKAKAEEHARKQFEKARSYFAFAVTKQPTMHEAWNYIGYTSRKIGEADKALIAYGEALRLKPGYVEAIEYRGVAYLVLNRIDDAKAAYMTLFRDDRKLSEQLMAEMQLWIAKRRGEPAGVSPGQLDGFAQWVNERSAIAQQTAALATDAASHWQ